MIHLSLRSAACNVISGFDASHRPGMTIREIWKIARKHLNIAGQHHQDLL
jgi:hypothetical protein